MTVITVSFRGQRATLDKDLVWRSEFTALQTSLRATYTRAWWKARHEMMVAAREPAYELAYMTAEELGGEVLEAPEDWGMTEIPDGAIR